MLQLGIRKHMLCIYNIHVTFTYILTTYDICICNTGALKILRRNLHRHFACFTLAESMADPHRRKVDNQRSSHTRECLVAQGVPPKKKTCWNGIPPFFAREFWKKKRFLLKPPWRRLTNQKTLSDCRQVNFFSSGLASTSLRACHASRKTTTSQLILFYGQRGEWPKKVWNNSWVISYKQETPLDLFSFSCFLQISISVEQASPSPSYKNLQEKIPWFQKTKTKRTDYGNSKHLVNSSISPQSSSPLRCQTPCSARLPEQCTPESHTRCTCDASM